MTAIVPVILSGGSGTRLWPMSRPEKPKQLLALTAEHTMLQLTALRAPAGDRFAAPIVVANAAHADEVTAQLEAVGATAAALILEPAGRNTAPAIALAALVAEPAAALLVMPSDHVIADVAAFQAAIEAVLPLVADGWLVTFGIAPDAAETGYGWIETGDAVADGVHRVARFVEKPPQADADAMLAAGGFAWNGGIFLFRADAYLAALGEHAPDILRDCRIAVERARWEGERMFPDAAAFAACPADSIDYAVMEKAARVAVVPVAMGWSDLGSWDALHALAADADDNALHGDVLALETTGSLVRSDGIRVSLVGVSDLIVVASGNDVLILPRGRSQAVKALAEARRD
ncbi:MAG: sugar phosphate nucleotidyltransferase [Pseudomonadota bacterium]